MAPPVPSAVTLGTYGIGEGANRQVQPLLNMVVASRITTRTVVQKLTSFFIFDLLLQTQPDSLSTSEIAR